MAKDKPIDFEKKLTELQALVEKMESGNLPLDDALKTYEKGIKLGQDCQKALARAEQIVQKLHEDGQLSPLDVASDDDC